MLNVCYTVMLYWWNFVSRFCLIQTIPSQLTKMCYTNVLPVQCIALKAFFVSALLYMPFIQNWGTSKLFSKVTDSMADAVERAYWNQNNPLRLASVRELNNLFPFYCISDLGKSVELYHLLPCLLKTYNRPKSICEKHTF